MTNEVKAKEIAAKYCEYYDGSKEADSTSYNSAMEMVRWKDEEIKKLKKEIADGEKFREELKRLCNERLDDRIALENELEEYKDATLISDEWLRNNGFERQTYDTYLYCNDVNEISARIFDTEAGIWEVSITFLDHGYTQTQQLDIYTLGQFRMFLVICGLENLINEFKK